MSLFVAGQTFRVDWVPKDDTFGKLASNPHRDLGMNVPSLQRIAIREGMGFEQERDTVLHETMHVILALTSNRDRFQGEDAEENVINALAVGLLAALRQNSGLAGYLTEKA